MADDQNEYEGLTHYCNWVVHGKVLQGSYPKRSEEIELLINGGVRTIVCLMRDEELTRAKKAKVGKHASKSSNRGKSKSSGVVVAVPHSKPVYIQRAEHCLAQVDARATLEFVHFPIYDRDCADDGQLVQLIASLKARVAESDGIVYIHCLGGHGRAGVVCSLLLSELEELDAYSALQAISSAHSQRRYCRESRGSDGKPYESPQTSEQRAQVWRLVAKCGR
jgi:Swiss Army Knife protein, DSP-PTPase phosphatase domain